MNLNLDVAEWCGRAVMRTAAHLCGLLLCAPGLAATAQAAEPVLRIQVVDVRNRPVAGVEVRAGQAPRDDQHDPVRPENVVSGKTSRSGEERLAGLAPGRTVWVLATRTSLRMAAASIERSRFFRELPRSSWSWSLGSLGKLPWEKEGTR